MFWVNLFLLVQRLVVQEQLDPEEGSKKPLPKTIY
jgi:hypothetical protein